MRFILAIAFAVLLAHTAFAFEGRASWYHEGQRVACGGARFNPDGLTAAHRSLPCGTKLRVTRGNRSVLVTVNDRGPAAWTRNVIDLSRGAGRQLGMLVVGVAHVHFEVVR